MLAACLPASLNAAPSFDWAFVAGGTGTDAARSVAMRSDGSSYTAGLFSGSTAFGGTQLTSAGSNDIFLMKTSSTGSLEWAVSAGGTGNETAAEVAVLPDGAALVAGSFFGTANIFGTSLTSAGSTDIFVAKVTATGTVAWVAQAGGTGADTVTGVAASSDGFGVITGNFPGTATFGTTSLSALGIADIFVARVSGTGTFDWAVRGGGGGSENGGGVAVVPDASAVLVDGSFPVSGSFFGSDTLTSLGGKDGVVARLNASTGALGWARSVGGVGDDQLLGIAAGADGTAIVAGSFVASATYGGVTLTSSDASTKSAVVAAFDATGSVSWAGWGGGVGDDVANDLVGRPNGSTVVAGYFTNTFTFGSMSATGNGTTDAFALVLSPSGTPWSLASAGGTGADVGWAVAADSTGGVRMAGSYTGPVTFGSLPPNSGAGGTDVFEASLTVVARATLAPTLAAPLATTRHASPLQVTYTVPESGGSGSITLRSSGGTTWTLGLTAAALTVGTHTVSVYPAAAGTDSGNIASASPTAVIPDGTYTVGVTYQNMAGDPSSSTEAPAVVIDTVATWPSLTRPLFGLNSGTLDFQYTLPEAASTGAITMSDGTNAWVFALASAGRTVGTHMFMLDMTNDGSTRVTESNLQLQGQAPLGRIPDGTYTVSLSYSDTVGNASPAASGSVTVDSLTQAPSISAPTAGSAHAGSFGVAYTLPEAGSVATITLVSPSRTVLLNLAASARTAGAHTVTIDPADPTGGSSALITAATPSGAIPEGTYTVTVAYRDIIGNASASVSASAVSIDATAPTVISFSSTTPAGTYRTGDTVNITATASEAVQAGNSITATLNTTPARTVTLTAASAGTSLTGTYTVQAGDSATALTVTGFTIGTVADAASNAMTSTTVPSGANNIAGSRLIAVDTTTPAPIPAPAPASPPAAAEPATAAPAAAAVGAPASTVAKPTCSGSKRQVATCAAKTRLAADLARCTAKPKAKRSACVTAARTRYAAAVRAASRLR